jgi:hypothetical protein
MRRIEIAGAALAALFVSLILVPTPSATAQDKPLDESRFITLQFDNDIFNGSDRHFTNGMRATWLSGEGEAPELIRDAAATVPWFSGAERMRISFSIGQNIFTPEDIAAPDPLDSDRPYAGWLFAGVGLVSEHGPRLDRLELDIGIIGPYSFADTTQTEWHKLIGITKPEGWDFQLKTEPGVVLYYERSHRALFEFPLTDVIPIENLGVDFTPHWGGALGNVFIYGAAGFTLRFGDDLPNDFGPPKIRPNLPGSDFFRPDDKFGWYLFAGMEGRLVARNIFLDGNTFRDSRSVDKIPVVADFQVGAAVTFKRARLAFTQAFRTKEFENQDGIDGFGSMALTIRY